MAHDGSTAPLSPGGRGDPSRFRELNFMRTKLQELQVKYDNQKLLLQNAEESVSVLQARLAAAGGGGGGDGGEGKQDSQAAEEGSGGGGGGDTARSLGRMVVNLKQENFDLRAQQQELLGVRQRQSNRILKMKRRLAQVEEDEAAAAAKLADTQTQLETAALRVEQLETLRQSDRAQVATLSGALEEAHEELGTLRQRARRIDTESKNWEGLRRAKADLEEELRGQRSRLLAVSTAASQRAHQLQNELHAARQFLEELKLEYEEYSETTKLSHHMQLRQWRDRFSALKSEYERFRAKQFEASRALHREQVEIIEALQSQFDAYRSTAESLFASEATKMEVNLQAVAAKHEHELQYIVKAKDAQYLQMVTSKDAKIMNLIEGTDFQSMIIQHQVETRQLQKQHQREVQLVREEVTREHQQTIHQLKQEIADQNMEIDKYHTQIVSWEKKLESTMGMLVRQKKQHAMKEATLEEHVTTLTSQLNKSYHEIEDLMQAKEALRHRILRLRLQLEGKADDSVDSMIRRLTLESQRLKGDVARLTHSCERQIADASRATSERSRLERSVSFLEGELEQRSAQFAQLTATFENFLHGRMRRSITGGDRRVLLGDELKEVLDQTTLPFLRALFEHRYELGWQDPVGAAVEAVPVEAGGGAGIAPTLGGEVQGQEQRQQQPGAPAQQGGGEEELEQQQQLQDPPFLQTVAGADGSRVVVLPDVRSRSTRMHRVVKGIPNMRFPQRLHDRRKDVPLDVARQPPPAARAHVQFKLPAKLRALQRAGELVDVAVIKELEMGFDVLDKFKRFSKTYANDARGRVAGRQRRMDRVVNLALAAEEQRVSRAARVDTRKLHEKAVRVYRGGGGATV